MALVVYVDEVGNHTLEAEDRDFPVFVAVLLVCDNECYVQQIVPAANRLKFDVFGHEGVILHSRDIRKAQGDFGFLTDPVKRQPFYEALNRFMGLCEYKLIAVAIRKDLHKAKYVYPMDPYDLAFTFALERLLPMLEGAEQTEVQIIAEKRGKREDRELFTSFQRVVTTGTQFIDGTRFRQIRFKLTFLPKVMNIIGTQMADLAAYPIARHVLDSSRPNPAYDVVQPKIYRGPGLVRGLKIFP
jgi:hypothetical protein